MIYILVLIYSSSLILSILLLQKGTFSFSIGFILAQTILLFTVFLLNCSPNIYFWIFVNCFFLIFQMLVFFLLKKEKRQKDDFRFFIFGLTIASLFGGISYELDLIPVNLIIQKLILLFLSINVLSLNIRLPLAQKAWKKSTKFSFLQLKKIEKLRTFAFLRYPLFFDNHYELSQLSHRRTIGRQSVDNLLYSLFSRLYPRLANLFVNTQKLNLSIIKQIGNAYISAKDKKGNIFELGILSYFQEKISRTDFNFYLFKNEALIASIRLDFFENTAPRFIRKFNFWQYNTVLINNALASDESALKVLNFDKIYSLETKEKIDFILSELHKKAPTAYVFKSEEDFKFILIGRNFTFAFKKLDLFVECISFCRKTMQFFHSIHRFVLFLQHILIFTILFTNFSPTLYLFIYTSLLIVEILVTYGILKRKNGEFLRLFANL